MSLFKNILLAILRIIKYKLSSPKDSQLQYKDLDIHIYGNSAYLSVARRGKCGEFLNWDIIRIKSDSELSGNKSGIRVDNLKVTAIVDRTEFVYSLFLALVRCFRHLFNRSISQNNSFGYLRRYLSVLLPLIYKASIIDKSKDKGEYSNVTNPSVSRILLNPESIDVIPGNLKKFLMIDGGKIQKRNRNKKSSNIILCLYVDNLSTYTLKNVILQQNQRFPNFEKISKRGEIIDNSVSASNWTLPAACSMFRAKPFHQHRIYHPKEPIPNDLLHSIHGSKNCFDQLQDHGWNTFNVTSNWRSSCKQGFTSGFNLSKDLLWQEAPYVSLAAMENIKLGSRNNSFHWISFMDSHHPLVHFVPTPSVQIDLGHLSWESGLTFNQRPNLSEDDPVMSEIYLAQLEMIDKEFGNIMNYAKRFYETDCIDVILLSDHGTSFLKQDKGSSYCYREKHSPCLVLPINRLKPKLSNLCKHHIWQHHELPNLILSLATGNQRHLSSVLSNDQSESYGISQIFYPGAKYEQIFFGNQEDLVFVYKSKANIPLNISYRWFRSDRKKNSLRSILNDGVWTNPIMNSELSDSQVPVQILDESLSVIKSWTR